MTSKPSLSYEAERFLRHVEQSLGSLSLEERGEIVAELRGHLHEKLASQGDQAVEKSLAAFGTPESYASAFLESASIRSAVASRSIGGMLMQTLKLAGRGVGAFITSLIVFLLFVFALSLSLVALLKPVLPDQIGLWTSAEKHTFALGFLGEASRAVSVEHLGYWIIPLGLAAGIALFSLATFIMRRTLMKRVQS